MASSDTPPAQARSRRATTDPDPWRRGSYVTTCEPERPADQRSSPVSERGRSPSLEVHLDDQARQLAGGRLSSGLRVRLTDSAVDRPALARDRVFRRPLDRQPPGPRAELLRPATTDTGLRVRASPLVLLIAAFRQIGQRVLVRVGRGGSRAPDICLVSTPRMGTCVRLRTAAPGQPVGADEGDLRRCGATARSTRDAIRACPSPFVVAHSAPRRGCESSARSGIARRPACVCR